MTDEEDVERGHREVALRMAVHYHIGVSAMRPSGSVDVVRSAEAFLQFMRPPNEKGPGANPGA